MSDIEQNSTTDFTGSPAGPDIPRLTGEKIFQKRSIEVEYVTVEPVGIVHTGISKPEPMGKTLQYTKREGTATGCDIRSTGDYFIRLGLSGNESALLFVGTSRPYLYRGTNSAGNSEGNRKGKKRHSAYWSESKYDQRGSKRTFFHLCGIWSRYGRRVVCFYDKVAGRTPIYLISVTLRGCRLLWFVLVAGLTLAGCKLFEN